MTDEAMIRKLYAEASDNEEFGRDAIGLLLGEIDRLRALIKEAETAARMASACPWCDATIGDPHAADCPAFTPNGDVH